MRNIFICFACVVFSNFQIAIGQSVDDIINQYVAVRGGEKKLDSVKSMSLERTKQMKDKILHIKIIKVDKELTRTDFELGNLKGYAIVTKDTSWFYNPINSKKIYKTIPSKSDLMMLDIAGPLVDYASKDYKATLLGKDIFNGNEVWKIQLIDTTGQMTTYLIDVKTNLLVQDKQLTVSNKRKNKITEIINEFSNYNNVDGILFPLTVVTKGPDKEVISMTYDKIEINIPVDEKLYKPSN